MIKWREYRENGIVFEAFIPEHEQEQLAWLLRASYNGHILVDRRIRMTWMPRFGPDAGDVSTIEEELETLIATISIDAPTGPRGAYSPAAFEALPSDPYTHSSQSTLLERCIRAVDSLGLSETAVGNLLGLPVGRRLDGLLPVAVSPLRADRMNRLIALDVLTGRHPTLRASLDSLLQALVAEDFQAVARMLEFAGVDLP